jgi:hypothetical protein
MVSHITLYLPFIAKPSLRLLDLTLSKTRFSSHISFLSRSLRYKVIPNGFKSSFNFDFHSSTSRHIVSRVTIPIAIFYFPLPTPTTPKGRFPSLSSFVFAASAVKMKIFRPKVWR